MKRILSVFLAVTLGLFTTACNQQVEEVILPETTLEPAIVETTAAPSQEPMTFFEEHGLEIEDQSGMYFFNNTLTLGLSGHSIDFYEDSNLEIAEIVHEISFTTERYFEEVNIAEKIDINAAITLESAPLEEEGIIEFVADFIHGNSDQIQATMTYEEYRDLFKHTYDGYKIVTLHLSTTWGSIPDDYRIEGAASPSLFIGLSIIDKYTGTMFYPEHNGDALTATINIDGTDYTISTFALDSGSYDRSTDELSFDVMLIALVPQQYDGTVFYVGPSSREQEELLVTDNQVLNFTEIPQFNTEGAMYFSHDQKIVDEAPAAMEESEATPTDEDLVWDNVYALLSETEMTYDETAVTGQPIVPGSVPLTDIDFLAMGEVFGEAGLCAITARAGDILVQNNKVDIYFINHDTNAPLTALIVADATTGETIGISGFIRPGESIDSIPVEEGFEGEQVVLFMAMYDPETQLDNGVILLSSFINN